MSKICNYPTPLALTSNPVSPATVAAKKKLPDLFTPCPKVIIVSVVEWLDKGDRNTLACVNQTFRKALSKLTLEDRDAAQIVLAQVVGCKRLTSMKALRKQLEDLKRYCPAHLGEDKPWTLAEVLRKYSLREIDFSKEAVSVEDVSTLLQAFEQITKECPPIREKSIEKGAAANFPIERIVWEMDRETLLSLNGYSGVIPQDEAELLDHEPLKYTMLMSFLKLSWLEFAEKLQGYYRSIGNNEVNYITEAYTQNIWGNIEVVDFGMQNPTLDTEVPSITRFLNQFCPQLKILRMRLGLADNQYLIYRFFLAPHRCHTLTHIALYDPNFVRNSIVFSHWKLLNVQNRLVQGTERCAMGDLEDIQVLADCCPHIEEACLNSFKITPENTKAYVQKFENLAQGCRNIKSLELVNFSSEQMKGAFAFVAKSFPKLQRLIFSNYPEIAPDNRVVKLSPTVLLDFLSKCPPLKSLMIGGPAFDFEIDVPFLDNLAPVQPGLEELSLRFDRRIQAIDYYRYMLASPQLSSMWFQDPSQHYVKLRIFQLRNLAEQLEKGIIHDRNFFRELTSLQDDYLADIHDLLGIFNKGYKPENLRDNLHLLREKSPFYSVGKNILSQITRNILFEMAISFCENNIFYLTEHISALKQGSKIKDENNCILDDASLRHRIHTALRAQHDINGNTPDDLASLASLENLPENVNLLISILDEHLTLYQSYLGCLVGTQTKETLQALKELLTHDYVEIALKLYEEQHPDTQKELEQLIWDELDVVSDVKTFIQKYDTRSVVIKAIGVLIESIVPFAGNKKIDK